MTFFFLIFVSIGLFLLTGWIDYKTDRQQPVCLIYAIPLIIYILTYGLRDGWFQDYEVYENIFTTPNLDNEYEFFFVLVNRIMRLAGFSVTGAMIVYAGFYVMGTFFLFTRKREYLGISMAVLVIINLWGPGQLVRWFMGVGMLYAGLRYLDEKKLIHTAVFFLLATGIHYPLLIVGAISVALYYLRPFRNLYANIALLTLSLLLTQEILATWLGGLLENFNLVPSQLHVSQYLTDPKVMDYFFQGDNLGITENQTVVYRIRLLFYYGWFMVCGFWVFKRENDRFWQLTYNMFVVSAIFAFPTSGFELMMRFVTAFALLSPVLFAYIIMEQWKNKKYVISIISILILLFNFARDMTMIISSDNLRYISL